MGLRRERPLDRLRDILVLRSDEQQVDGELLLVAEASSIRLVQVAPSPSVLWFLPLLLISGHQFLPRRTLTAQ